MHWMYQIQLLLLLEYLINVLWRVSADFSIKKILQNEKYNKPYNCDSQERIYNKKNQLWCRYPKSKYF